MIKRNGSFGLQHFCSARAAAIMLGLMSGLIALSAGNLHAAPGQLSQSPLFLASPVQPNIFFLLDDSGSMDQEDLLGEGASGLYPHRGGHYMNFNATTTMSTRGSDIHNNLMHCVGYNVLAYDPSVTYTPWVGYDKDGNRFSDQSPTKAMVNPYTGDGGANACTGSAVDNFNEGVCNLKTGFKTGKGAFYYVWHDRDNDGAYDQGECSSAANSGDDYTPSERKYISNQSVADQNNYANWFSYYRKREYVMKRAVTEVVDGSTERMGFATINRNNHVSKGTEVGTPVKDIDDLAVPINATAVANKKTLLDNLAGVNSSGWTPLRIGLERTGQYYMGKMTTTALFGGNSAPPADPDSASGSSPILAADLGGTCQQNFAIVMSDGFWNGSTAPSVQNTDIDGAGDFDGQSYGDSASSTLADVAMHYYETDLLPIANEVPIVSIDVAPGDVTECSNVAPADAHAHPNCYDTNTAQHLVTYTVAFGIRGQIPETDAKGNPCVPNSRDDTLTALNWPTSCDSNLATGWPTPVSNTSTTVDDMMHAAWNGRGQFLSAKDPAELISSLQNAIDDIASKNPVAAAAVGVDTGSILSGGNVVQAKFDSNYWSGELYSYPLTATGVSTTSTWSAHDLLAARSYTSRIAVTYNGSSGIPFAFPADYTDSTNFGNTEISQDQLNDLMFDAPYSVTTTDTTQIAANQAFGEKLVAYLLGDSTNEGKTTGTLRYRDGKKLGDIIHSAPVYVGDPDSSRYYDVSYQNWANNNVPTGAKGRREMIYVGANDGGLHAFDATTGTEVFVYFPKAVFSTETRWGLHYLANRGYEHRYYVDGDVTVAEVYANVDGTGDKWRTILVGTLRGGGRSIYAIDISEPSEFTTASGVAGNILWEFSDTELGFTYGKPTIAKLNNGRWAAIFGNGYIQDSSASGEAMLFIKYLDQASPSYHTISTGVGSNSAKDCLDAASNCNGLSTPAVVDLGADGAVDRVYAGDLMGNLWVFDISSATPASWGLAYTAAPLINAKDANNVSQPITGQPAVILHPVERHSNTSPNTMVFFGTGQYITETDLVSNSENTFYGIWDNGSPITSARDAALVEQTITATTLGTDDIRIMSNNPVNYSTHRGWFADLPDNGERVIARPFALNNVVFYNTIVPESNLCSTSGGYSWLMIHNLVDGSEPDFIALDVNNDGIFNSTDQKGGRNVTGRKSGNLNWQITPLDAGAGEFIAVTPSADIDSPLGRSKEAQTRRSSWGRYDMD
jgi:type IV pilus assembly protein PilY1